MEHKGIDSALIFSQDVGRKQRGCCILVNAINTMETEAEYAASIGEDGRDACPVEGLTGFSGALASGIVLKVKRSRPRM